MKSTKNAGRKTISGSEEKVVTLSFCLPAGDKQALIDKAWEERKSVSDLLREIIRESLNSLKSRNA